MYFSKIQLNKTIKNKYKLHQYTRSLFKEERERNFIFRIFNDNLIYMYSKNKLKDVKLSKEYPLIFKRGNKYFFSLKFCPVIKVGSKKFDLILFKRKNNNNEKAESLIMKWFQKREENMGFKLLKFKLIQREEQRFTKKPYEKIYKYFEYDIEGQLEVLNPDVFKNTLKNGIGDKRVFGCGMLLLK